MLNCIYEVWYKIFAESIHLYPPDSHIEFVNYGSNILNIIRKKVRCYIIKLIVFPKQLFGNFL